MPFLRTELWPALNAGVRGTLFVLAALALVSLLVFLQRLYAFAKSALQSRRFSRDVGSLWGRGDLAAAAISPAAKGKNGGHLGRVLAAGLHAYRLSSLTQRDATVDSVARALQRQTARETHRLKWGIGFLATVRAAAALLALSAAALHAGVSFHQMAANSVTAGPPILTVVAQSLIVVGLGLGVAVFAWVLSNGLRIWVDAWTLDLAEASNAFLDVVAKQLAMQPPSPRQ